MPKQILSEHMLYCISLFLSGTSNERTQEALTDVYSMVKKIGRNFTSAKIITITFTLKYHTKFK